MFITRRPRKKECVWIFEDDRDASTPNIFIGLGPDVDAADVCWHRS
jgi:hypothetical protein